jgi:hypothetical protein
MKTKTGIRGGRVFRTANSGMKVQSGIKSGMLAANENQTITKSGVKVRSGVKAGLLAANENQRLGKSGVKVRTGVKSGAKYSGNENQTMAKSGMKVQVRSKIKAGSLVANTNQTAKKVR